MRDQKKLVIFVMVVKVEILITDRTKKVNKMKKYILKSIIIFSAIFFLSGCYTVLWMPEDEFPTESSYNEFYSEPYYGDYYSFYDYPWWLRLAPPSTPVGSDYIRNENGTTSSIRNEGQGQRNRMTKKIFTTISAKPR